VLDATQLAELGELGHTRIVGAFDPEAAERMRAVAWRELESRYGLTEGSPPAAWPQFVSHMKTTKHSRAFAPIASPALADAADQLLGPGRWKWPKHWGQVMVTPPRPDLPWQLPHRLWHTDFEYTQPLDRLVALRIFVFFGEVAPHGGGTLLIEGSHRMTAGYVASLTDEERADYKRVRDGFMRHDPWLEELSTASGDSDREARFMGASGEVDGVPARVVELTGRPGDIVLTHPWVYHCAAPNATAVPRLMRGSAFRRCRGAAAPSPGGGVTGA
jgi:hypothetical protein